LADSAGFEVFIRAIQLVYRCPPILVEGAREAPPDLCVSVVTHPV
jgi:hypothetical protein